MIFFPVFDISTEALVKQMLVDINTLAFDNFSDERGCKMANSRIGQYSLEFNLVGFTNPTRSHALRLWLAVSGAPAIGALPTAVNVQRLGGTTANLQVVADQIWSYFRQAYPAAISATGFTLWKFVTENSKQFISAGTLAAPAGNGAAFVVGWEAILTFRHAGGGIGKIVLIESNLDTSNQVALVPNAAGNVAQKIAAFMLSADSPMLALDNSFPVAALRDSRGQNEAIWRKIFRNS